MILDKNSVDPELACRLCAAFVSYQMGFSICHPIQENAEDVGDLLYFLAALAKELAMKSQDALYQDLGGLATTIIQ